MRNYKLETWTLSQADTNNQICVGKNVYFCEQHVVRKLFTIPGKFILSTGHSMIVPLEFINWFPDSVPAKHMLEIIFSTFSFLHLIMHSARNITKAAPRAPASKMKIPMTFSRARASMPVPRHPLSEGQELK